LIWASRPGRFLDPHLQHGAAVRSQAL
jgi:hypothetical protein